MIPSIFKILTPKVLKAIMNYVFEKNALDHQMEAVLEKIEILEKNMCRKCNK
mgnify:FL=1|tara:strand:- start:13756 stop:13911 length:156 start_codon:yes stop_codon:yes gene_type:complete